MVAKSDKRSIKRASKRKIGYLNGIKVDSTKMQKGFYKKIIESACLCC